MRKIFLVLLFVALFLPSCSRYEKKDLVGFWMIESSSSDPFIKYEEKLHLVEFNENGDYITYIFDCGVKDFDSQKFNAFSSSLNVGKWDMNNGKVHIEHEIGYKEDLDIYLLNKENLILTNPKITSAFGNDTTKYIYIGKDSKEAVFRLLEKKYNINTKEKR